MVVATTIRSILTLLLTSTLIRCYNKVRWILMIFFIRKLEFPRIIVEREDQVKSSEKIGLGWSQESKNNKARAYLVDKR